MDPLTAGLLLAKAVLDFGGKLWDAMTPDAKALAAQDWATTTHNMAAFLTSVQAQINSSVGVK